MLRHTDTSVLLLSQEHEPNVTPRSPCKGKNEGRIDVARLTGEMGMVYFKCERCRGKLPAAVRIEIGASHRRRLCRFWLLIFALQKQQQQQQLETAHKHTHTNNTLSPRRPQGANGLETQEVAMLLFRRFPYANLSALTSEEAII